MSDDDDFDDDGNDGNHNVEGNDGNDRHEHSLCHRLSLRGAPGQQAIKSNAAKMSQKVHNVFPYLHATTWHGLPGPNF